MRHVKDDKRTRCFTLPHAQRKHPCHATVFTFSKSERTSLKKFSSRAPQSPAPRKGHPGSTKPQGSELNDMILYAATHDTTSVLT